MLKILSDSLLIESERRCFNVGKRISDFKINVNEISSLDILQIDSDVYKYSNRDKLWYLNGTEETINSIDLFKKMVEIIREMDKEYFLNDHCEKRLKELQYDDCYFTEVVTYDKGNPLVTFDEVWDTSYDRDDLINLYTNGVAYRGEYFDPYYNCKWYKYEYHLVPENIGYKFDENRFKV